MQSGRESVTQLSQDLAASTCAQHVCLEGLLVCLELLLA